MVMTMLRRRKSKMMTAPTMTMMMKRMTTRMTMMMTMTILTFINVNTCLPLVYINIILSDARVVSLVLLLGILNL